MNLNSLPLAARLGRCALLVSLAGLPLAAPAANSAFRSDPGFFIGGGIGYDRLNGEDFTGNGNDIDDKRVTYKGFAGFRLGEIVSLEAQYLDFGTAEGGGNRVDAHGTTVGAVFDIPAFQYVHPYGKAGVLFWDADGQFNNVSRNDQGEDFAYGAGLRFMLNDNLDLRAEYERFELDESDVDNLSAMIQFNF